VSVWATIVHYGHVGQTRRTIASVCAGEVAPDVVLVVDNQGDFTAPRGGPSVRTFRSSGNVGYAGAMAYAAGEALAGGASWIWVLNNDVEVGRSCLAELLDAGTREPRAALLTPVILRGDGTVWYAAGTVDMRTMATAHCTRTPVGANRRPYDTDYATGCAVLCRTAFVADAGPPDASLFMYYEDVEWSLRARGRGWRVMVVPAAHVRHDVAMRGGHRVWSPLAVYLLARNRLLLAERGGHTRVAVASALSWGIRQCAKGMVSRDGGVTRRALYAGLRDGLLGRSGPPPGVFR